MAVLELCSLAEALRCSEGLTYGVHKVRKIMENNNCDLLLAGRYERKCVTPQARNPLRQECVLMLTHQDELCALQTHNMTRSLHKTTRVILTTTFPMSENTLITRSETGKKWFLI